jgi:hypothetical protein
MKPELTQKELSDHVANGETIIAAYRTPYLIRWSHGVKAYIMQAMPRQLAGLPLTKRGRYHAMSPTQFQNLIN